jgi:hypothetical protein
VYLFLRLVTCCPNSDTRNVGLYHPIPLHSAERPSQKQLSLVHYRHRQRTPISSIPSLSGPPEVNLKYFTTSPTHLPRSIHSPPSLS